MVRRPGHYQSISSASDPDSRYCAVLSPIAIYCLPAQFHPSYTKSWTASVQHEFGRGWQFQLQYIGSNTHHAPGGYRLKPGRLHPRSLGCGWHRLCGYRYHRARRSQARRGRNTVLHDRQSGFSVSISRSRIQLRATITPAAAPVRSLSMTMRYANYNGMVATLQHRLSSTFSLLANYTWSKCLNIEDSQGDLQAQRSENINNPDWITVRADPTTGTSKTSSSLPRAILDYQPRQAILAQQLGVRAAGAYHKRSSVQR